jgi:hypothetical protein
MENRLTFGGFLTFSLWASSSVMTIFSTFNTLASMDIALGQQSKSTYLALTVTASEFRENLVADCNRIARFVLDLVGHLDSKHPTV